MNAAHGFLNMLARLVNDRDPTHLACATDEDWRPQWRVELIESYKTHRLGLPEDQLDPQIPVIFELVGLVGVAVVGCADYEAEDVIGALIAVSGGRVEIVSGDRDLFQLVHDPDVVVLYPKRGVSELLVVDETEITSRYGIPGRAYGDFALLRGDPSDGLPGVPGIGEKTASLLIAKYQSLGGVIEAALTNGQFGPLAKVRKAIDYLDRAARCVLISSDAPIDPIEKADLTRPRTFDDEKVMEVASGYGLGGPMSRLMAALKGVA